MAYFVCQYVHGSEARRWVRFSECVRGTKLGDNARILLRTDTTHGRQTCEITVY